MRKLYLTFFLLIAICFWASCQTATRIQRITPVAYAEESTDSASYSEEYPIYKIVVRPAFLRNEMEVSGSSIVTTLSLEDTVLVLKDYGTWYLVCAQDEMIGFVHHGDIEATGEFQRADIQMSNIQPAGHEVMRGKILLESDTVLPDTDKLISSYPSTLVRQTDSDYQEQLLPVLLGKNYRTTEDTDLTIRYASSDPLLPYRYARVNKTTGRIWFYDSMVTGERDGEYAAHQMNTTFEESLQIAQKQASKMLGYECVAIPSQSWLEYLRIEYESSDAESERIMREMDAHTFVFERLTDEGISVLDGGVSVTIGKNGISELVIDSSKYGIDGENSIVPISIEETLLIVDQIRYSPTVLVYAELTYSNWITEDDRYNLSWYLVTTNGNYVVDCVIKEAVCDRNTY